MAFVEPLVMLPPMFCDGRVFAPQVAELSRERAVMVAPVHTAERIEEIASSLLDVLPQKFALAGMGFGGMVAAEVVRRASQRVTRLALIATTPLPETPEEASAREPRIIAARMGRIEDVLAEEMPVEALYPGGDRARVSALLRRMAQDLGPEAYIRQARAMQRRKDQTTTLRNMSQPILILAGRADSVHPEKRQEFLAELLGGAELKVLDDAGLLPSLEQPVPMTDALRGWLGSPLALR